MDPVVWAAMLLVLGLLLVAVEIFVPTGGLLGVMAFSSIVAGILLAFFYGGLAAGAIFVVIAVVALPTIMAVGFHYLPHTPIGRQLLASAPDSEAMRPDNEELLVLKTLVGKLGTARSLMLPSGAVEVEGRVIDAVSEGMPIEPGQAVRIVGVRGMQVMVRPDDGRPPARQPSKDDVLSQPFDAEFDPFDEPRA